jgi:hypothetical protein
MRPERPLPKPLSTDLQVARDLPPSAQKAAAVHRAIDDGEVGIVFQPLVDVRAKRLRLRGTGSHLPAELAGPLDLFRPPPSAASANSRAFRGWRCSTAQFSALPNIPNEFDDPTW